MTPCFIRLRKVFLVVLSVGFSLRAICGFTTTNEVKCASGGLSLYFMSPPSGHSFTHLALIADFKNLSASDYILNFNICNSLPGLMKKNIPDLLAKSLFTFILFRLSPWFPQILKEWLVYIAQINCFLYDSSEVARSQRHTTSPAELWCICLGKFEVICHTDICHHYKNLKATVILIILQSYNFV